jgi:hypothetical protein
MHLHTTCLNRAQRRVLSHWSSLRAGPTILAISNAIENHRITAELTKTMEGGFFDSPIMKSAPDHHAANETNPLR